MVILAATLMAAGVYVLIVKWLTGSQPSQADVWRSVDLEDMPRHPERVPDPDEDTDDAFWDIAEALLDDGLGDVAERLGWLQ